MNLFTETGRLKRGNRYIYSETLDVHEMFLLISIYEKDGTFP